MLVASPFQYKGEVCVKEITLDGTLGETRYYTIYIKLQGRGSPQVHLYGFLMHQILKMKLLT